MRINANGFRKSCFAAGFAGIFLFSQTVISHANPVTLASGASVSASSEPYPSGANLLAATSVNFSSSSLLGVLVSSVYSDDSGNQYGLGALTFVYQILLSNGSPDAASSINIGNFSGFNTDVGYASNGGVVPTTISRDPNGRQIVFDFGSYILPGQDSAFLIIQTDATTFTSDSASVSDGFGTPAIFTFAPVSDKTGIGSFIFALGLLVGYRRLTRTAALNR